MQLGTLKLPHGVGGGERQNPTLSSEWGELQGFRPRSPSLRGPIAAATCSAVTRCVDGSTSTNLGVAPIQLTASAVAMNEFAGTITSSPGPISSARRASEIASVPDETLTA